MASSQQRIAEAGLRMTSRPLGGAFLGRRCRRGGGGLCLYCAAVTTATQRDHDRPEYEQHRSPPEIHIDIEGTAVERVVARRSEGGKQRSHDHEQQPERYPNIQSHASSYIKMMFSNKARPRTIKARIPGR